jgi:hypothetical protein
MSTLKVDDLLRAINAATREEKKWMMDCLRHGAEMADKLMAAHRRSLAWSLTVTDDEYADALPIDIDEDLCVGRILSEDERWEMWTPILYKDRQCSRKPLAGGALCAVCQRRKDAFPYRTNGHGAWNGEVTEPRPGWSHMFGTDWAEAKKVRYVGK